MNVTDINGPNKQWTGKQFECEKTEVKLHAFYNNDQIHVEYRIVTDDVVQLITKEVFEVIKSLMV